MNVLSIMAAAKFFASTPTTHSTAIALLASIASELLIAKVSNIEYRRNRKSLLDGSYFRARTVIEAAKYTRVLLVEKTASMKADLQSKVARSTLGWFLCCVPMGIIIPEFRLLESIICGRYPKDALYFLFLYCVAATLELAAWNNQPLLCASVACAYCVD